MGALSPATPRVMTGVAAAAAAPSWSSSSAAHQDSWQAHVSNNRLMSPPASNCKRVQWGVRQGVRWCAGEGAKEKEVVCISRPRGHPGAPAGAVTGSTYRRHNRSWRNPAAAGRAP